MLTVGINDKINEKNENSIRQNSNLRMKIYDKHIVVDEESFNYGFGNKSH